MFTLKTQRLRRRLSVPTSGSVRRRARERQRAEQTRIEGERIARERREKQRLEKIEQQKKDRFLSVLSSMVSLVLLSVFVFGSGLLTPSMAGEELASYVPWGRAGGGAPNPHGFRFTNLRARGIYPENELKGISGYEEWRRWSSPKKRRTLTPLRLHDDPQLFFAEQLRRAVDNDIRYKQTTDQKKTYKEILDDMVDKRSKAIKDEIKHNLEFERKLISMDSPWGKPGPGGKIWRNPRNIGLNFSKSMGWTDNEIFDKLKGEHKCYKRSSLTLPEVKRDDDSKNNEISDKENFKTLTMEKLPYITTKSSSHINNKEKPFSDYLLKGANGSYNGKDRLTKSPRKNKFVKHKGERIMNSLIDKSIDDADLFGTIGTKPTPEGSILRLTGGIELVPLLARRRRVGARTLPSSDVTRPPEHACQWREMLDGDYLNQLRHQMRVKSEKREECRRTSAESVRLHHATWSSLWGRPGHGAPQQRGRYARNNLAQLLYVSPLTNLE